jgi:hypothetical protein
VVVRKQLLFQRLHHRRLGVLFVIHAEKVKDPVNQQQGELVLLDR